MNQTFIYLQTTDGSHLSYACIDAAKNILHSNASAAWDEIATLAKDTRVIVVVPATDVLLTEVTLPKLSPQRLRQALPYAVEEHLAIDVEKLHVAIINYDQNHSRYSVAIVEKNKMETWLALLHSVGIYPAALIPASLLLPHEEHYWHIVVDDKIAMLRTASFQAFGCDTSNLDHLLTLAISETNTPPQRLLVHCVEPITLSTTLPIEYIPSSTSLIEDFAHWFTPSASSCLLQGDYTTKASSRSFKKYGLWAAGLALSSIVVMWIGHLVSFLFLEWQSYSLEKAMFAIYQKNFPQAHRLNAPKQRMQEKLKTLRAGTDSFLIQMTMLGKAFAATPRIHLIAINFHQAQMTVELSAPSLAIIDQLTQSLQQQGAQVTQQNMTDTEAQAKATLNISGGQL